MRIKAILIIWILISTIIVFLVGMRQIDTYVSVKYEVHEFLTSDKPSELVQVKQQLLGNMVFVLWTFGSYLIINIVLLLIFVA